MPADKVYFQKYYLQRKRKLLIIVGGENFCCAECGVQTEDLEFDHINPLTKSFTIGQRIMRSWRKERFQELLAELSKCQLLCYDCHKDKTRGEQSHERGWTHGSIYGWMKKKCHCDDCNEARDKWNAERNEQRRLATGIDSRGPRGPYGRPAEHGTELRYHRGCRCDECRAANTAAARERRERKANI